MVGASTGRFVAGESISWLVGRKRLVCFFSSSFSLSVAAFAGLHLFSSILFPSISFHSVLRFSFSFGFVISLICAQLQRLVTVRTSQPTKAAVLL